MSAFSITLPKGLNVSQPHWSRVVNQKRTAFNLIVPGADLRGNFYDKESGKYLGTSGAAPGERVYVANSGNVSRNPDGTGHVELNNIEDLPTTHTQFQSDASTIFGESSSFSAHWQNTDELAFEMATIAYIYTYRNRTAYGINSAKAVQYRNTNIYRRNDDMHKANWALINAIRKGTDYSNGATQWDGPEQGQYPASITALHPPDHPNWVLHMNDSGWRISDEHYAKWKRNCGRIIVAPQVRVATVGPNKGKTRLISAAVYARSIFWQVV